VQRAWNFFLFHVFHSKRGVIRCTSCKKKLLSHQICKEEVEIWEPTPHWSLDVGFFFPLILATKSQGSILIYPCPSVHPDIWRLTSFTFFLMFCLKIMEKQSNTMQCIIKLFCIARQDSTFCEICIIKYFRYTYIWHGW
jgi:hypothetical protein